MEAVERYKIENLSNLCNTVREMCEKKDFNKCLAIIAKAMGEFPDDAAPHNLYGVVLEIIGDHLSAMKHFRAAWSLDPTYSPVNQNLQNYGTFLSSGKPAFDESDVLPDPPSDIKIVYDERGVGHVVKKCHKNRVEYDKNGVAHIIKGDIK